MRRGRVVAFVLAGARADNRGGDTTGRFMTRRGLLQVGGATAAALLAPREAGTAAAPLGTTFWSGQTVAATIIAGLPVVCKNSTDVGSKI